MKLILANILYRTHGTDEGEQLQAGLALAGWTLAGFGYGDGCVDVPTLLDRHKPGVVLVQAREDWDAASPGCFDKRVSFKNIAALAQHPSFKVQVVKDCPGRHDRRQAWCAEIKADALLTYYHSDSTVPLSPWMADYPRIRHRHTIGADTVKALDFPAQRARCIVSGAMNREMYPLRTRVMEHAKMLGVDLLRHPGYGCIGNRNADYLRTLSQYKVSVACASRFGFALRKQLESLAAGCVVVTDLPEYDGWPWLDDAMIRVPIDATAAQLREAIDRGESQWSPERAERQWQAAIEHYDWKLRGVELSEAILKAAQVPV